MILTGRQSARKRGWVPGKDMLSPDTGKRTVRVQKGSIETGKRSPNNNSGKETNPKGKTKRNHGGRRTLEVSVRLKIFQKRRKDDSLGNKGKANRKKA